MASRAREDVSASPGASSGRRAAHVVNEPDIIDCGLDDDRSGDDDDFSVYKGGGGGSGGIGRGSGASSSSMSQGVLASDGGGHSAVGARQEKARARMETTANRKRQREAVCVCLFFLSVSVSVVVCITVRVVQCCHELILFVLSPFLSCAAKPFEIATGLHLCPPSSSFVFALTSWAFTLTSKHQAAYHRMHTIIALEITKKALAVYRSGVNLRRLLLK